MHKVQEQLENTAWHVAELNSIKSLPELLERVSKEPFYILAYEEAKINRGIITDYYARLAFWCKEPFNLDYSNPYDWQIFLYTKILLSIAIELNAMEFIKTVIKTVKDSTNLFWTSIYIQSVIQKQIKP